MNRSGENIFARAFWSGKTAHSSRSLLEVLDNNAFVNLALMPCPSSRMHIPSRTVGAKLWAKTDPWMVSLRQRGFVATSPPLPMKLRRDKSAFVKEASARQATWLILVPLSCWNLTNVVVYTNYCWCWSGQNTLTGAADIQVVLKFPSWRPTPPSPPATGLSIKNEAMSLFRGAEVRLNKGAFLSLVKSQTLTC